ncbi:MAG: ABC transporter ATP-binding protein [Deferribacterales bacterium]
MKTEKKDSKKGLWPIMSPVMTEIRSAMFLAGFAAFVSILSLVLIAYTLSLIAGEHPAGDIGLTVGTSVIFLLITTVIAYMSRGAAFRISHLGAFHLEEILRTRLSAHLARVPLGYIIGTGSGTLKKVMLDDVKNLHAFVADTTPFVGRSTAAPLASLVVMYIIDWRLATASVAVLVAGGVLMFFVMRDSVEHRKQYDRSQESINSAVIEYVQAMPVVRIFDDGTSSFRRFNDSMEDYRTSLKKWIAVTGVPARLGMMILSPLPTLLTVTAAGIWLMSRGSMDVFSLTASILLSTGMADAMMPLMWISNFIKKSEASALRIQDIMNSPVLTEPEQMEFPKDSSIEFRNVFFKYENRDEYALKDVSFTAAAGTVTALVGPSGAGKSTVAKLIPRFWDVDAGSVIIGGADIRKIPTETLMKAVSFVFQDTFLFNDTLRENIRMANPKATDVDVMKAAGSAQIHEFIMSLPDGYDTIAGDRGVRLSGGQKQRITIAMAILHNAPIVVLDEATAFADPENEEEIIKALAMLMKNKTVIVIAHRLSSIKDADQIVVFDGGQAVESGTHTGLIENGGLYARLWQSYERAQAWDLHRNGGNDVRKK